MARLNPDSPLVGELWLVISELRADTGDGLILRATGVDESALQSAFPERFRDVDEAGWDEDARAVTAARVRRFEQIVLSRKPIGKPDASLCVNGLLAGIRRLGLQALEFSEAQQQWRLRVALLRQHCPELALPDLSDSALLATLEAARCWQRWRTGWHRSSRAKRGWRRSTLRSWVRHCARGSTMHKDRHWRG